MKLIQRIFDNKYLSNNEWVADINEASQLTNEQCQQAKETYGKYKVKIVPIPESAIDVETKNYLKRSKDGSNYVASISAYLMAFINNGSQIHKQIDTSLLSFKGALITGQWKDARDLFLSLNINEISIEVYKKINTEVNNYIELNY